MTDNPAAQQAPEGTDERLRLLESQVQTLADAVRALAQGLERIPSEDAGPEDSADRGARLAHELLLAQGL
ncbi:hypothetical protein [Streptomyces sp. XD-27]|uniref:hypothetical protein n=1 Tax=Streptomyces sp. XD-27 TaxID=3062779 RepID=UPI0026F43FC0|nr:hypothetical protein [Streptomyces sp. XD-27]WKX69155.1 hypothetical protein Q3Y56_03765 [Streptomyces sp. XD-27]